MGDLRFQFVTVVRCSKIRAIQVGHAVLADDNFIVHRFVIFVPTTGSEFMESSRKTIGIHSTSKEVAVQFVESYLKMILEFLLSIMNMSKDMTTCHQMKSGNIFEDFSVMSAIAGVSPRMI